jgi:hypothetical protein
MVDRVTDLTIAESYVGTEIVEISKLSPTIKITATTISALATDNSYNDSAAGFVAAGFAVGDRVFVSGFTGNVVNNIFIGTIETLTTTKMTIESPNGDVIVDDAAGESVTIIKWTTRRIALSEIRPTEALIIPASDEATAITTGTAKMTIRMQYAFTVLAVRASLTTAQASGSIFTVDINEGGVSILSTKLTIDNTEKTSTTAATPAVISDSSLADDAEITIDVDQVGDGTAKGLKVTLIGHRT